MYMKYNLSIYCILSEQNLDRLNCNLSNKTEQTLIEQQYLSSQIRVHDQKPFNFSTKTYVVRCQKSSRNEMVI